MPGVVNVDIEIEGKTYNVPCANRDHSQEIYYLRKALSGDTDAYEMLVGNSEVKWIFIGQYEPLWAKVTKYKVEVVNPQENKNG